MLQTINTNTFNNITPSPNAITPFSPGTTPSPPRPS